MSASEVEHEITSTGRAVAPGLEAILHRSIPVLDHGFIRVVDYMGDDAAVVQAARVSYGKGTKAAREDRGLIHYLMRHWHTTPFEMCEIKLHVKLPIFVARQWIRHRTANVNEYSARYSVLDREFYIPSSEHLAGQSTTNRQGRDTVLSESEGQQVLCLLREDSERNYDHYLWMLNETEDGGQHDQNRSGLTRELARIGLGVNSYTQWYWKTDLHNLFRFIRLRADAHAQYEIRVYADVLQDIVARWVPISHEAFIEHQFNAVTFSATAMEVVRRLLRGEQVRQPDSGLSKREWEEICLSLRVQL